VGHHSPDNRTVTKVGKHRRPVGDAKLRRPANAAQRVDAFLGSLTHELPPIPARRCSQKVPCREPLQRGARLRPPLWRAPHPLVEWARSSETPPRPGSCGFQYRRGHRHMGESFTYKGAMGPGLEHLLSNVEAGSINWSEVYECLKTPLWYAAARGARQVGVRDGDAVAEAVRRAFPESLDLVFARFLRPDASPR